jgi:hypothetical protein
MPVKLRPFFVIQNSSASLFALAAALVRSVAGGYVSWPKMPFPSPFAPWQVAHDPV